MVMASARTTFDVVVTNYNYGRFVTEAIDGALAQTRPPERVVVVDDGSTDGSPALLTERYGNDPRVVLLLTENGGQLAAFIRGTAPCAADVICYLDADDRWSPDYLAKIGELYDSRPDVDFVFSDLELFGNEQGRQAYANRPVDLGITMIVTVMMHHWYGAPTSALSMRRRWAGMALDMPADMLRLWHLCADNCLVLGASVLGARKYFLPTGSVHYRVHGANGWHANRTPEREFLNALHIRCLIQFYANRVGFADRFADLAKQEYLLKIEPTWDDTLRYAKLVQLRPGPWYKKLERALSIKRRGRKYR
jgi:glycosyltransferase involved in cell wall biosynthesis